MEKLNESAESEAQQLFNEAVSVLRNQPVSSPDRLEKAFEFAKKSHAAFSGNIKNISLLLALCFELKLSVKEAGLTDADIQFLYKGEEGADYIQDKVEEFRMRLAQTGSYDGVHTAIEVLEAVTEIDPQPFLIRRLSLLYRGIGRIREGLQMLFDVAKKDVEDSGPKYILACFHLHRYQEIVDYYEAHQDELASALDAEKRNMIAVAYEQLSRKRTFDLNLTLCDEVDFKAGLKFLRSAERLYEINRSEFDPVNTCELYPTPDEIHSLNNHGQIFSMQAQLIGHNQHFAQNLPDPIELRKKAIGIHMHALDRIGDRERVEHWRKIAVQVKLYFVNACNHRDLGIDIINRAIDLGEELMEDEELRSSSHIDIVANNLYCLYELRAKLTGEYPSPETIESLLLVSFKNNWRSRLSYTPLIEFYEKQGLIEKADRYRQMLETSPFLEMLINMDLFQSERMFVLLSNNQSIAPFDTSDLKRFKEQLRELYEHTLEADKLADDYMKPLSDSLQSHQAKFHQFLESISPNGADIQSRIKDIYSLILKMLKERKIFVPEVTDIFAFRVLTDTEDEAREVYNKVRECMKDNPKPKEWLTLDSPTPTGYRSMDITGVTKEDGLMTQVQIRTKRIEELIDKTKAHHDYYKVVSGEKLLDSVNEDPVYYLELFLNILKRITIAYNKIFKNQESLTSRQILTVFAMESIPQWLPDGESHDSNETVSDSEK